MENDPSGRRPVDRDLFRIGAEVLLAASDPVETAEVNRGGENAPEPELAAKAFS